MKNKSAVLEYCLTRQNGRKAKWAFRFKNADGDTLIESAKEFDSKLKAEEGFVSLIKSVATNQYKVEFPQPARHRLIPARSLRLTRSRKLVTHWN